MNQAPPKLKTFSHTKFACHFYSRRNSFTLRRASDRSNCSKSIWNTVKMESAFEDVPADLTTSIYFTLASILILLHKPKVLKFRKYLRKMFSKIHFIPNSFQQQLKTSFTPPRFSQKKKQLNLKIKFPYVDFTSKFKNYFWRMAFLRLFISLWDEWHCLKIDKWKILLKIFRNYRVFSVGRFKILLFFKNYEKSFLIQI